MTNEALAESLVPLAAELVGTVRDYGPDDVAAVLARVPKGRHDALAVVLASMVDPDESPANLLAWTTAGPVQSRDNGFIDPRDRWGRFSHPLPREHGTERGYQQHRSRGDMPACDDCRAAHREDEKARKARRKAAV